MAAAAGLLLAGAGAASATTVVKWLHLELDPKNVAAWEDIVKKYEAQHPDVDIQMQFLENEAFKAKLPTLLQSDDVPDFFFSWGGGVLKQQSETGALQDVTAALDGDGGKLRSAYTPSSVDGLTFDGKTWAIPYKVGLVSFFYNKTLFAKAGVKAEDIKTWSDFLATVQKIKAAGIVPIAGGGGEKWPIHFYWSYLVMPNVLGSMEQFSSNPDNSKEANNAGNFVWRSAWDIPELTALTAKASMEPDAKKRGELYVQMQKMFVEQKPAVLPLFERFEPIVLNGKVEGYVGHPSQLTRLENVTKVETQ